MNKPIIDILWVMVASGLVFLMQAGFTCLESGMTRLKNSINVAIKNLTDVGLCLVLFWAFGFALMFGTSKIGWIGATHFFADVGQGGAWLATFFLFEAMFCSTSVTIVSGAVAERMRFGAYILVAILIAGFIYPIFGHWAWGGMYELSLGELNSEISLGWLKKRGFVDFAGSTVVHSTGGWVALAALLIIGPRAGRFPPGVPARKIQGSNLPISVLGTLLLWLGWFGFNGGSTFAMSERVPEIIANTFLSSASGAVAALAIGWPIKRRADVELPINGTLAGLVAITANCYSVTAQSAVIIGAIGGIVMFSVREWLEHLQIDDAVGAVSVHLGAGVWGTLAVALFGRPERLATGLERGEQLLIQIVGILTCFLMAFGTGYLLLRFINNRFLRLRVTPENEQIGLNISEHGATTELLDLFMAMETQEKTMDIGFRVPVEPFTEVGQIAERYNRVMDALQQAEEDKKILAKFPSENPNPVLRISTDGVLLYANTPSTPLLNLWGCQIGKAMPDTCYQTISEVFDTGLSREVEVACEGRLFSLMFAPVVDADYLNLYGRDITERKRLQDWLEADNVRKTEELENARRIQRGFLPSFPPELPDLEIEMFQKTATEVGGDYYDFNLAPDGTLTVAIGDVTGHGLTAGIVVAAAKTLFKTAINDPDNLRTLDKISQGIKSMNLRRLYMALTLVRFKDGKFTIAAAGMPPVLIYRAATECVEEILLAGLPLGSGLPFQYQQQEFQLQPGDTILLMSDGFPELLNPADEMLGYTKTKALFEGFGAQAPEEVIARLCKAGETWAKGRLQEDDVTFVVMKVKSQ